MPGSTFKIINDPVYGFISIPRGIVLEVIDHPWFQRLRSIRQLSLTHYVYPGAQHTRFQHAIGALHLMDAALITLKQKGVEISDAEVEAARLAILLHDIGHGPFSHTLEGDIIEARHEQLTLCFMRELNRQFDGRLGLAIEIFEGSYSKPFLHQLVQGQLDIDRLDYLNRDTYFTGVSEGTIGSERIIKMLHVVDGRLVVEEKGVYSLEKFLIARRLMYWQVYLHKTVLAAEIMLKEALRRMSWLLQSGNEVEGIGPDLRYFLSQHVEACAFDDLDSGELARFARLDDVDVVAAIKAGARHEDRLLNYLCDSLLRRRLFRLEFRKEQIEESELVTLRENARQNFHLDEQAAQHLVIAGAESNHAYMALKDEINILHKDGTVRPLSSNADFEVPSRQMKKYFLAFPKILCEQLREKLNP